jgi:aryl-alcohol dehydrogenase-like predicted oxidoreductase
MMPRPPLDRRSFLKTGLAGVAGAGALSTMPSTLRGRDRQGTAGKPVVRPLGKTGLALPVVSMGVMNSNNDNLIRAALDGGIVHLDTAHGYQRGTNEGAIGQVLKGRRRDSFVIATKVPGEPRDRQGNFSFETKAEAFLDKVNLSLERLGLEYVDILYLHNVQTRESVLFEPLLKALDEVKKSGKARFIGVSTHSNEHGVIRAALEGKVHDVVLLGYNFRKTNLAEIDAAMADGVKAGLGFVAMKTLAGGFWDRERKEPINTKAALKWALQNPNITTAIPGMTAFDQLEQNLAVMTDIALTAQEKTDLKLGQTDAPPGLYCQGCQECVSQCPRELPLPDLMRSYMYAYGYKNLGAAYDLVASLGVGQNPCLGCGRCSVRCTMGFDVRGRATDIARLQSAPAEFFA